VKKRLFTAFILIFLYESVNGKQVLADIFEDYQTTSQQLAEVRKAKEDLSDELKDLSGQLTLTESQIMAVSNKIAVAVKTVQQIDASLSDRRGKVSTQEELRNSIVRDFYIRGEVSPLVLLVDSDSWEDFPKRLAYYKSLVAFSKRTIENLNDEINNFEANKKEALTLKEQLAAQQQELAALQNKLSGQADDIKQKLSHYAEQEGILGQKLEALSSEISSQMSWQQQAALGVKESGAGRANTPNPDGAPSWRIVGFGTEHGVGMSQWGAFMKAMEGWDAERILKFYYQDIDFTETDIKNISVSGYGSMDFEDEYLAGIGETDPVWYTINENAAKVMDEVQVIAARTYAYDYAKNGKTICTTQACQVYVGGTSKKDAVEKTRGKIMTYSGNPIRAFYFSTSGPHTDDIGDTPSFAFNDKTREYKDSGAINDSYPYLRRVDYNDGQSQFNNWSAIIPNDWRSQAFPPKSDYSGGTPLGQIDMEDVLNTALLSTSNLESVSSKTSMEDVRRMLKAEGKEPIQGLESVSAVEMGGSSSRVKWVTAKGSNRSINEGEITGIRFRYAFNVRSPEKDWIYSTWFEFK